MCGIAGIVAADARKFEPALRAMNAAQKHRGPDGEGVLFFDDCALAHVRLSIIDLAGGAQPMRSPISDTAVTFNGEIYGFLDIRKSLLKDYPFKTNCDTELILALYDRFGVRATSHLPGMFSFALWDPANSTLYCGRDRFGEKPFYYAFGRNGEFIFASEIKGILASGLVNPVLDRKSLGAYLQYLYVPPGRSIYANIYSLPPAHQLVYRNGNITVERYWSLPPTTYGISPREAADECKRLLDQAVKRQLVADVPVGAFLSGGLDSSTIVALASSHVSPLRTFSFSFEGEGEDPRLARQVAHKYATEHVELADHQSDIAELLPLMQKIYDEPFADSSNIPMFLICRQARSHIPVVLSGDGGDELFAGYTFWYHPLLMLDPGFYLYIMGQIALKKAFPDRRITDAHLSIGLRLRSAFRDILAAHGAQKKYFQDQEVSLLGVPPYSIPSVPDLSNSLDDALRSDLAEYMPGDILVKIDRASMAHGLELRAPFLDVDFASFCIALPWQLKMHLDRDKHLIREAFGSLWPTEVQTRGKEGFGAPVQRWLKQPRVAELKRRHLENKDDPLYQALPWNVARPYADRDDYRTWILLVLSLWLGSRQFTISQDANAACVKKR